MSAKWLYEDDGLDFKVVDKIIEHGKSRVKIECPHCDARFWAFLWSISGGGKKCEGCGAIHTRLGKAYKPLKNASKGAE